MPVPFSCVRHEAEALPPEQQQDLAILLIKNLHLNKPSLIKRIQNLISKIHKKPKSAAVFPDDSPDNVSAETTSGRFFSLDCENVALKGVRTITGRIEHPLVAGRVVVVEWKEGAPVVVLDKTIKRTREELDMALLRYHSRFNGFLTLQQLEQGTPLADVSNAIANLVRGHTLVTLAGAGDFKALGITPTEVRQTCLWRELHSYWVRWVWNKDGVEVQQPCGLGPICDYLGYDVVIQHDCINDAKYTLRIFMEQHDRLTGELLPGINPDDVMSGPKYKEKHGLA